MVSSTGPVGFRPDVPAEGGPSGAGTHGAGRPPLLPAVLPKALTWLSDNELVELASAVAVEQARRKPEPSTAVADARKREPGNTRPLVKRKARSSERGNPPLPRARINAIRAAFKAGVKPSVIARQFGVTQQAIREALTEQQD